MISLAVPRVAAFENLICPLGGDIDNSELNFYLLELLAPHSIEPNGFLERFYKNIVNMLVRC